jgi:heme-degrading monooxygenase HmoA
MPLISVTRLRVRSFRFMPGFLLYAFRSNRQVKQAAGNLGASLLNDSQRTFWTCSAWVDEAAMRTFMMAPPHRNAMVKLLDWCDEASLVHWTQESAQLQDWQEVHRRLVAGGRRSKIRHPSAAHEAFQIPPPKAS